MPQLDTSLHLEMLRKSRAQRVLRVAGSLRREWRRINLYGTEWGDVELVPPLRYIRDTYVKPFVRPDAVAVEIGPGGGRWTSYLLPVRKLYVVDYHQELLDEHQKRFRRPNVVPIKNNGNDFPGVERGVDFVFSFDVFVHLDANIIEDYLKNLHTICTPQTDIVIHYSDMRKVMAQTNERFSDNDPERMRGMVEAAGYTVVGEDTTSLWHGSVVHFRPALA